MKITVMDLNYIIWDVNPEIFTIPYFDRPIRWYGLFWGLGIYLAYQLLKSIFTKEGKPVSLLDSMTVYIVLGTILGARLGHVLFYDPAYYFSHPLEIFAIWQGGLASHGGGIGILIAIYLFSVKEKLAFMWVADRIALVVPLCGGFIRLGNLMNSEMIGIPSNAPWAFVFTGVDSIPRHPAQLYEALFCFILFAVLYAVYKRGTLLKQGDLFALLLISLFSFRIFDEFFKINQSTFEEGMFLNMGQLLSIPFILVGIAILLFRRRLKR